MADVSEKLQAVAASGQDHRPKTEVVTGVEIVSLEDRGSTATTNQVEGRNGHRRVLRNIQRYVWDDPDKPEEEKRFLFKLDCALLTYACLAYFCKNLDQSNISNAYVSGMKEDLNLGGSELTYMSNVFTAGYVISQLPAVMLVTKVRPSYLVPTLEVLWSVVTFSTSAARNVSDLYALRFLVGLCEGAFFPCIVYVISSWYTKGERGKRMVLFYSTVSFSQMFSGYLQAAAYDNLDGTLGRAGWSWLFIICGIISLPVGLAGYFLCPDFPENTRAFYLNEDEAAYARKRLLQDGYKPLGAAPWNKKKLFKIVTSWQFWVLSFGYFFVQSSFPSQQPFYSLWLKATDHTVYQIDTWATGQPAIGAVTQIVAGMLSDSPLLNGKRWQAITVMQGGTVFGCTMLAIWNIPIGLKYFAFYISYMSAGVPALYFASFADVMKGDHEMRGFMIAFSNIFSYINQIWFADAVWRTAESPEFRPGFIAAACFGVLLIFTTLLMRWLEVRDDAHLELASRGYNDVENASAVGSEEDGL